MQTAHEYEHEPSALVERARERECVCVCMYLDPSRTETMDWIGFDSSIIPKYVYIYIVFPLVLLPGTPTYVV